VFELAFQVRQERAVDPLRRHVFGMLVLRQRVVKLNRVAVPIIVGNECLEQRKLRGFTAGHSNEFTA
jgi:hypothetical protein